MSKQAAQNTTNQITEGVIWKQLLIFFFPILFGTFFQQLYNTADAIIVGNFVGKEALASVGGSASTIINLLVGFFVGLSSGATVIISQYYGADNRRRVSDSVHTAIALAIASERPDCDVTAVDVMPDAVTLAQRNVARLGLTNVTVLQSSWFSALETRSFEMIVSNPPYIDEHDPHLAQGDVRFEPLTALVAANAGLADLDHIVTTSRQHLLPGGWLLVEHGWTQGEAVRALFTQAGYTAVETCRDYGGNERLTLGQWA